MSVLDRQSGDCLAIGIYDLDRLDKELFKRLLVSRLDPKRVIEVELGSQTVRAIPFRSDISLVTAALAIDVLRSENRKANEPEVQVYLLKGNGTSWSKIQEGEVLTINVAGKYILNQRIFGVASPKDLLPPVKAVPPRIRGRSIT